MATLVIYHPRHGSRMVEWEEETLYFGRMADQNDLIVDDMRVSSRHAQFSYWNGRYWVEDLDSTNGTYLGADKIDRVPLKNGDELLIGEARIRFGGADEPEGGWGAGVTKVADILAGAYQLPQDEVTKILENAAKGSPDSIAVAKVRAISILLYRIGIAAREGDWTVSLDTIADAVMAALPAARFVFYDKYSDKGPQVIAGAPINDPKIIFGPIEGVAEGAMECKSALSVDPPNTGVRYMAAPLISGEGEAWGTLLVEGRAEHLDEEIDLVILASAATVAGPVLQISAFPGEALEEKPAAEEREPDEESPHESSDGESPDEASVEEPEEDSVPDTDDYDVPDTEIEIPIEEDEEAHDDETSEFSQPAKPPTAKEGAPPKPNVVLEDPDLDIDVDDPFPSGLVDDGDDDTEVDKVKVPPKAKKAKKTKPKDKTSEVKASPFPSTIIPLAEEEEEKKEVEKEKKKPPPTRKKKAKKKPIKDDSEEIESPFPSTLVEESDSSDQDMGAKDESGEIEDDSSEDSDDSSDSDDSGEVEQEAPPPKKLPIGVKEIRVSELIREIVETHQIMAGQDNIRLEIQGKNEPTKIVVQPMILERAMTFILSTLLLMCEKGSGITVTLKEQKKWFEITISVTSKGIKRKLAQLADYQEHLGEVRESLAPYDVVIEELPTKKGKIDLTMRLRISLPGHSTVINRG